MTDVQASLRFYVNQLGFTNPWRYDEDGKVRVAQVDRQGCALILADTWPEKIGKGLLFISLNVEPETCEAAIAALDGLRAELEAKGVHVKEGSWGYRLLVVDDPDGNQLFFNYLNETASSKTVLGRSGGDMSFSPLGLTPFIGVFDMPRARHQRMPCSTSAAPM
ncbi:MAG: VOC family protein [Bryobacteraceae bacterium]